MTSSSTSSSSIRTGFFSRQLRRQDRLQNDESLNPPSSPDPRDHGLRTPPAPPNSLPLGRTLRNNDLLMPPPPSSGVTRTLDRAHTDPNSSYCEASSNTVPISPPPSYDDVIKQVRIFIFIFLLFECFLTQIRNYKNFRNV